jgi:hypothetical protein
LITLLAHNGLVDEIYFARSWFVDASNNVKDRGLTSAIWANEGSNLTLVHMKIYFIKGCNSTKFHGDVFEFKQNF